MKTSNLLEVEIPCNLCPFSLAKNNGLTKCNLTLESFAYSADKVDLGWLENDRKIVNLDRFESGYLGVEWLRRGKGRRSDQQNEHCPPHWAEAQ